MRFAKYDENDIHVGSIGGSPTIHLLAAVAQERPCDRPKISKSNKLDKTVFFANADFRKGIEVGINIWVMKWQLEEMFPDLPCIFQSALNAKQHVGSGKYVNP